MSPVASAVLTSDFRHVLAQIDAQLVPTCRLEPRLFRLPLAQSLTISVEGPVDDVQLLLACHKTSPEGDGK